MKLFQPLFTAAISLSLLVACSPKTNVEEQNTISAQAKTSSTVEPKIEEQVDSPSTPNTNQVDRNGDYINSDGILVTISNYEEGKGFEFSLSSDGDSECGGLSYDEQVQFKDDLTASNEIDDLFKFNDKGFTFEPSIDMIGMDCATILDSKFTRK